MSIKNLKCECCTGNLKQLTQNKYKCESCGQEYIDHISTDEERIWLASANKTLRMGNFDDAYEEFNKIVEKYPNCYEAYYGMTLCSHGIIYIDDILENKKVPTCYNVTITSFLNDINYKKTLELCPKELKANYEEQARKIEVIRQEWVEKVSKEPPYDIFISFKKSDKEKNIKETSDYLSAFLLYNHLKSKLNLNVFFSPETLKNKVAERYEPYIYHAINTSKVMIVYGEKPEYINSTWVKNEWARFLRKIKNKEKEPNSLVVVYKGFDPYNLPKELRDLQALDKDDLNFSETLINHINKILEKESSKQKIERKEIKVGQVATRSRTIGQNQIVKRELGTNVITTRDASIAKMIETAEVFISNSKFDKANSILNDVKLKEPNNSEALFLSLLIKYQLKNSKELHEVLIDGSKNINMNDIDELISKTDKQKAIEIINVLKNALISKIKNNYIQSKGFIKSKFEDDLLDMFNVLSRYDYDDSNKVNKMILDASAVNDAYLKLFNHALRTLEETQVDEYVNYHVSFVKNIEDDNKIDNAFILEQTGQELNTINRIKTFILQRALKVDEGNGKVLFELFKVSYDIKYLELALQYAKNKKESNKILKEYLVYFLKDLNAPYHDIIQYIDNDDTKTYNKYVELRYEEIKKYISNNKNTDRKRYIKQAIQFLNYIIKDNGETSERLFELYKYNLNCVTDEDLINYPESIENLPTFTEDFMRFDKKHQEKILKIVEKQNSRTKQYSYNNVRTNERSTTSTTKKTERKRILKISLFTLLFTIGIVFLGFIRVVEVREYPYVDRNFNLYMNYAYGAELHNYVVFVALGITIFTSLLNTFLYLIRKNRLVVATILNIIYSIGLILLILHCFSVYLENAAASHYSSLLISLSLFTIMILVAIHFVVSIKFQHKVFDNETYEKSLKGGIVLKSISSVLVTLLSFGVVIGGGFIPFFDESSFYDSIAGIASLILYCIFTIRYILTANNDEYDDVGKKYVGGIVIAVIVSTFAGDTDCTIVSILPSLIFVVGGLIALGATKIFEDLKFDIEYAKENKK